MRWLAGGLLALLVTCHAGAATWQQTWTSYVQGFISPDGRVIDPRGQVTTSEGQAYAMFFALVSRDRRLFDKLLQWTSDNLAAGELGSRLPAWRWGKDGQRGWGVIDQNSAADADLWLAYSLLEGARIWNHKPYLRVAQALLQAIKRHEVTNLDGLGPMLLMGRYGSVQPEQRYLLNPSYMPLPVLIRLAEFDPGGPWNEMILALPDFIARSSPSGFAPDWVIYDETLHSFANASSTNSGSYDAIRVYLWSGLAHPVMPGAGAIVNNLNGMAMFYRQNGVVPHVVDTLTGKASKDAPVGFSAAILPFVRQAGLPYRPLLKKLNAELQSTGLYGNPAAYYDQNLVLFGLGGFQGIFRFDAHGRLRFGGET